MIVKSWYLIISLFFISVTSFSQKNYIPGYVVLNTGDTLKGFIDYRNWSKNPEIISFRITADGADNLYDPNKISAFGASQDIYESAIVQRDDEAAHLDSKDLYELRTASDTVFLRLLYKGKRPLYFYKSNNRTDNFYIKRKTFDLLIYKSYVTKKEGISRVGKNNTYISQLEDYFACLKIERKVRSIIFNAKNLVELFEMYDRTCGKLPQPAVKSLPRQKFFHFGISSGVTVTSLAFKGNWFRDLENSTYGKSTDPTGAFFYEFTLPRDFGKWSFYNEIAFSKYATQGYFNDFTDANNYRQVNSVVGYAYLKSNNLVRFKYPIEKLFIYLNLGISNGLAVSEENAKKI